MAGTPKAFDYDLDFAAIDFRREPQRYRIGKGEQGVLLVEPYKGEILPHWRFKTPEVARQSAKLIYKLFLDYRDADDFVGMDMARKYLQMGVTRSRRYANHRTGRKYGPGRTVLPLEPDELKARAAEEFLEVLEKVRADPVYRTRFAEWRATYG